MGLIFGAMAISVIIFIVTVIKTPKGKGEVAFAGFVVTALVGVAAAAIAGLISALFIDPYNVQTNVPIVLMADGTSTGGRISLFRGSISTQEVYRYYQRDGNGGLHLYSQNANVSVIYEDAADPYIITNCSEKPDAWYILNDPGGLYDCTYEFHVPEGSVSNETVLDAN